MLLYIVKFLHDLEKTTVGLATQYENYLFFNSSETNI